MKKLFFTGGGGAGSEAIYRLLSSKYELYFGDADIETISCSIPGQCRYQIPYASSPVFVNQLEAICKELNIDLLIPGVDEELSKMPDIDVPVMLPDSEYVELMLDKLLSANAISGAGLNSPRTISVFEFQSGKEFIFPCIVKPRVGRGSRNVYVIQNADQVNAYLTFTGLSSKQVVLQELVEGTEYTVLMSSDCQGNLKAVVPVKIDVKRGITIRAETDANQAVIDGCKSIHHALPAIGCYNIQLIYSEDGRVMPFEINPRISTTFCLGLSSGVDPIEIYLGDSSPGELMTYQAGVMLRRSWVNNFITKEA
jgi:carbamoyl-phosphate synthase large subunit